MRTALSHAHRRNRLTVVDSTLELSIHKTRALKEVMEAHGWTRQNGGTLFVTFSEREKLELAARNLGYECLVLTKEQVEVRDVLKWGRLVFERRALKWLEHETLP